MSCHSYKSFLAIRFILWTLGVQISLTFKALYLISLKLIWNNIVKNDVSAEVINCDIMIFQNVIHSESAIYDFQVLRKNPRILQAPIYIQLSAGNKQTNEGTNRPRKEQKQRRKIFINWNFFFNDFHNIFSLVGSSLSGTSHWI